LNCPQCGFANEPGDAYCGGCGRNETVTTPANVPSELTTRSQILSAQNLSRTFLEEIFKEESGESEKNPKDEKKAVTQDEIDELFDKNQ
jgi:uncharacterized Zn finger protein (UPF0148 family)